MNSGLWDYALFEIGITEIMFKIGIIGFQSNPNWDYRITCLLKLGSGSLATQNGSPGGPTK